MDPPLMGPTVSRPTAARSWWKQGPNLVGRASTGPTVAGHPDPPPLGLAAKSHPINLGLGIRTHQLGILLGPPLLGCRA